MDKPSERINELLQEIRIVLPGTQALLGFQFIAFFNAGFKELSPHLQTYHLINLLFVTLTAILLIAPVAYQEIKENGRNTGKWIRFTSRCITIAMACLLAGLAGDIFIATSFIQDLPAWTPYLAAIGTALVGALFWFGFTVLSKRTK